VSGWADDRIKRIGVCRHCFKGVGHLPDGTLVHQWRASQTCGAGKGKGGQQVELRIRSTEEGR
jgi:hypothetical protein